MGKTYKHNQDQRDNDKQAKLSKKVQGMKEKRMFQNWSGGLHNDYLF